MTHLQWQLSDLKQAFELHQYKNITKLQWQMEFYLQ